MSRVWRPDDHRNHPELRHVSSLNYRLRHQSLFLLELAPCIFYVLDVEEVASPLFLPELAPGIVCILDVEEVVSSL